MSTDILGLLTFLAGAMTLLLGPAFGIYAVAAASILGAAAALQLPALGGSSVPPGAVLLGFLAAAAWMRPRLRTAALSSLVYPSPGFWFAILVAYSLLTALFLPRIFAGMTLVYSVARTGDFAGIVAQPLSPSSSNVTQSVYFLGDLVLFAVIAGYTRLGGGETVARALRLAAILCLVFAAVDVITYATGTQDLMSIIRNANYRLLDDVDIGGIKRIVGSFTEAGAYAYAAVGLYAFMLVLWLERYPLRFTGTIALLLLLTLILATSSTGYFALAFSTAIVLLGSLRALVRGRASRRHFAFIYITLFALPVIVMSMILMPAIWQTVVDLFNTTVVNKLDSESGLERMRWNERALTSFFDTFGIGVGIGSVRASSLIVAILANLGVVGFLLYGLFVLNVVRQPSADDRRNAALARAGIVACFALLAAGSVSAGSVDPGLYFCIYAAAATGARSLGRLRSRVRVRIPSPAESRGGPVGAVQ